jgi:DHA2 family multidrug resistance protein
MPDKDPQTVPVPASGAPAAAAQASQAPMHGGQLAITALVLAMGTFMQVLDSTIANVSLPTIAVSALPKVPG